MLMAECTEWMGCENWLTDKAASPAVAEAILAGVQHMEGRALASGEDIRGSQPTGDNIAGGLTTIEEKSMGAVKKIGDSPIIEYLEICQAPTRTEAGNYVMYGPGMGAESISSMAAAGCQVLTFCTGGGHTSNHPIMPTVKVTANRQSFELMRDTVDVDVSGVFYDEITLAEAGQIVFDEVERVCNGYLTKSEALAATITASPFIVWDPAFERSLMQLKIPYGKAHLTAELPKALAVEFVLPKDEPPADDPAAAVMAAVYDPIGDVRPPRKGQTVAIAINDKTRPVPHEYLLPPVLGGIRHAGIADEDVLFIIATRHAPVRSAGGVSRPFAPGDIAILSRGLP